MRNPILRLGRWFEDLAAWRTRQIVESAERAAVWAEVEGPEDPADHGTDEGDAFEAVRDHFAHSEPIRAGVAEV
jgi:hypothetical protein